MKYAVPMSGTENFTAITSAGQPVILDGGLATQLEAQGCDLGNPLWSASIIGSDPEAIVAAHRAYLEAGADIIITASYQAVAPDLVAKAVELALRARDACVDSHNRGCKPLVAGSVGPYGAVLSDGSEYTGAYDRGVDELRAFHRARLEQLDAAAIDVLACETIPSFEEAMALAELLRNATKPAWVSFSCRDGERLNDGTPIAETALLFRNHPTVRAVGVNCTAPQYVTALLKSIRQALPDMTIIAYPNSGETFEPVGKTWHGTTTVADWIAAAREWRSAGAGIIGGCCRTGPEHIAAIRQALEETPA